MTSVAEKLQRKEQRKVATKQVRLKLVYLDFWSVVKLSFLILLREVHENSNSPHFRLRERGDWPRRRRTAEQRDEVASFHHVEHRPSYAGLPPA